jgi:hypothetical protein
MRLFLKRIVTIYDRLPLKGAALNTVFFLGEIFQPIQWCGTHFSRQGLNEKEEMARLHRNLDVSNKTIEQTSWCQL